MEDDIKSNTLLEWNFAEEGGKFIAHPYLSNHLMQVVELLADFVTFKQQNGKKIVHTHWDSPVYQVIPTMMIDIAYGCRIDSGYRLVERCARHAVDSKAESSLQLQHGAFFLDPDSNKIGLNLKIFVPASMRDALYETEAAVTCGSRLVACSCTCPTGGSKEAPEERVACVHVLPILLMFSFFLVDCLAEHVLLELSALLNSDQNVLNQVEKGGKPFMKTLKVLMRAAQENSLSDAFRATSAREMLQMFSVGTENRKNVVTGTPNPDELGPIRTLSKKSISKRAGDRLGVLVGEDVNIKKKKKLYFHIRTYVSIIIISFICYIYQYQKGKRM